MKNLLSLTLLFLAVSSCVTPAMFKSYVYASASHHHSYSLKTNVPKFIKGLALRKTTSSVSCELLDCIEQTAKVIL